MRSVNNLHPYQLMLAFVFVIFLLILVKVKGIKREREILISSIRMTLQLYICGFILVYLFSINSPIYTVLVFGAMEFFSIFTIFKRSKHPLSSSLKKIIALSMIFGTTLSLFFFLLFVIQISPWYETQYFIPIAGMLIGNSMTGISLGVNSLSQDMSSQRQLIEGSLMLGATPKMATKQIVNNAFDSAILPTIHSMVGMGIVFLPGMMTGQILSGTSPAIAIEYQIAIMLGILGSVSLSVILFVQLGYKTFFNSDAQFKVDIQNSNSLLHSIDCIK